MSIFRLITFLIVFIAILSLDQSLKIWADTNSFKMGAYLPHYPYGGKGVFHGFLGIDFSLNYVTNTGAAWGVFSQFRWALLGIRCVLILVLLLTLLFYRRDTFLQVPLVLILAGAVGNVLDVLIRGHVVDMFKFVFWGYHFPVFNIADSFVSIGIVLLVFYSLRSKPEHVH